MAVSFHRAPTVEVGEKITSSQLRGLAMAFNDRLRSGLGDGPWRILFYFLSMFRQPRNPDAAGTAFPANGEFLETYQHVGPRDGAWPVAGPGEPEGANLASQLNQFVFGAEALNLASEADRVNEFPFLGAPPSSPSEAWAVAKAQRGAWDPTTGAVASPAFTAAQSHWRVRSSRRSPHGNSFGGWQPEPEVSMTGCTGDPSEVNYIYKFTRLSDAAEVSYPGSCSDDPTHIAGIVELPWAYYAILNDGSVDIYPANEWIEGPYVGEGVLQKRQNDAVARALNTFAREFRGSDTQREQPTYHLASAFDFHQFMTRQYLLAPQRGQEIGGSVEPNYAKFEGLATDTFLQHVESRSSQHVIGAGCVIAGALLTGTGGLGTFLVQLLDEDGEALATVSFGNEDKLWFPEVALKPERIAWKVLSANGGTISVEVLELLDYKPQLYDAALFLRCGAVDDNEPDGVGTLEPAAYQISDNYFEHGCCVNINGDGAIPEKFAAVNANAVFDAARRLSRYVRLIRRQEFTGYAVIGGDSVLWFRRTVQGLPGFADADIWQGILDEEDPKKNGIKSVAPKSGYTNEWLLGIEFKAYHPSISSIWKPDAYSDYFPLNNRCHLYSPEIAYDKTLRWHYAFGQSDGTGVLISESPSGHNYSNMTVPYFGSVSVNSLACDPLDTACIEARADFYRSCQVYRPDPEIKSVTLEENGEIKVVMHGRLQHHEDAPESIARDTGTWVASDIEAESYRTDENGLRAYLLNQTTGRTCASVNGDASINGALGLYALPDNPFGSCYPHFRLTKLIPSPYEDTNDSQQPTDTHFEHDPFTQMDLYLRAMCEGYVDGETTKSQTCISLTSSVYDFTFQNLCFQAFGGKSLYSFTAEDRPDRPEGFGPLPNTLARAVVFNQVAQAVNLLTRVRVMLPGNMEVSTFTATVTDYVPALLPDGNAATCSAPDTQEVYHDSVPSNPTIDYSSPIWAAGNSAVITSSALLNGACDGGGLFAQPSTKEGAMFRYALGDDVSLAIPDEWRSQFIANQKFVVQIDKTHTNLTRKNVTDIGDAEDCDGVKWQVDGGRWLAWDITPFLDEQQCDILGGEFEAPPLERSDTYHGVNGATDCPGGPVYRWEIWVVSTTTPIFDVPMI